jgi:hypothetical protein
MAMTPLMKAVLAGTTALAIAGGSPVYAQQSPGPERAQDARWRPTAEDVVAFGDARIAALKAGLKLTAEQEKHWPALEQALRDAARQRSERYAARASTDRPRDPIERLRTHADTLTTRGSTLKSIADAAAPLYQSLDENQKRRFAALAHFESRRFARAMRHGHHGRYDHRMHRGGEGPGRESGDRPR